MKKQLLLGALFLGSLFTAQAQGDSCAAAENITVGTYTNSNFPGAGNAICWATNTNSAGTALTGAWYKFTATENGYLTVSSAIEPNDPGSNANPDGIDTRLSILSGTCDALACYNGNDDAATADWRSTVTFAVASGSTYYIVWDNYWQEEEFDFELSFVGATCFYPSDITIGTSNLGTTSFTATWDAAIGNPSGYEVLYGPEGFDPETEGTTLTTSTTSVDISGQAVGASIDFYIRSLCGGTETSDWTGPYNEVLATTLPYENGFEELADLAGFRVNGFGWTTDTDQELPAGTLSNTPEGFFFSNVSATVDSNSRLFIRPIYLQANEQITVDFYAAYLASTNATFEVTIGTSTAVADQTVIGEPFELEGSGAVAYNEFLTAPYTATASGVYYIVIHNTTPAAGTASTLLVDTLLIDSELGTGTVAGNKLSVYPNPSTDIVNVANAGLINNIKVTDLNGRTVKAAAFDGVDAAQVSIADLASGVYMMTVASDKGTNTTKIVKN
jgi:hypothetical protein